MIFIDYLAPKPDLLVEHKIITIFKNFIIEPTQARKGLSLTHGAYSLRTREGAVSILNIQF